ncbi:hypothetical protein H0274_11435 [Altererythrobacter sp. CC-YST694]|uniref:hypothetical protein n=1 Tax=Altererythrobacter sp. CC-YST694 TaxID=2755038 RepID=UPI001D004D39|nr:hypothetical protein [Altererythrobacter sp. CC-YST694]MCB5425873.1 hypothetical protein [Altererythrobacter sp. CC-YST694]
MMRSAKFGIILAPVALVAAGVMSVPVSAEGEDLTVVPPVPRDYKPATTSWGEPDLRGGWPIDHLNGRTPLERDPKYGNRVFLTDQEFAERDEAVQALSKRYENEEASGTMGIGHWAEVASANRRTSWIIDPPNGRLPPYTEEGKRRSAEMRSTWAPNQPFEWVSDFDSWDRCITRGLPASMFPFMYNNGMRIFQAPGLVALQMEMVHETRMIYTDGRKPIPVQIQNWLGESRGHWENGNTLVVETTNFKPGPSATNIGTTGSPPTNNTPISESAKMTERFTMTGKDTIVYEVTLDDPVVFTKPWTARLDWQRDDGFGIFEYACHEGNVQVRNYINASRAQRAEAGKTGE